MTEHDVGRYLEDMQLVMSALRILLVQAVGDDTPTCRDLKGRLADIERELHPMPLRKAIGFGKTAGW